MAKVKKVKTAREEAMEAQAAFDQAVERLGASWRTVIDWDRLHQDAFDLDADRSQQRFTFLLEWRRRELAEAEASLAKWQSRLAEDPVYAFEWADGAMEAAARVQVLKVFVQVVEKRGERVAQSVVLQRVLEGAARVSKSSGQCHNLMHQFVTAAWASVLENRF